MDSPPSALRATLDALGRAAIVVDREGQLIEANTAAHAIVDANGRAFLEAIGEFAASGRLHEEWGCQAVAAGEGRRAFLCIQRSPIVVSREPSVPVSFAATEWRLTTRQHEILTGVVEGRPNRAIAELFGIKERTVEAHITAIFVKAHVASRAALIGRVFTMC